MSEGSNVWCNGERAPRRLWTVLCAGLLVLAAGCGSVALSVKKPTGTKVEMYEKVKWFWLCGPDWLTWWHKVEAKTVQAGSPCQLDLAAHSNWLDSTLTFFPRQYRASFDLSAVETYPQTPSSVVEVRYMKEAVPPKHQELIRLWQGGRTLDVLTHLPPDVLGDVLYSLGYKFKDLLNREVAPDVQKRAAADFNAMLQGPEPTPKEVESWLKSFLTKEQLDQLCGWVRDGVELRDARWVPLGGEPQDKNMPAFWRLLKDTLGLFVKEREVRETRVDFFKDVILRDLLVMQVESKLVNVNTLRFYAEVVTFDTTYYTDRVTPEVDLVQDIGLAEVVRPTLEQEAELQKYGMTRATRLDAPSREEAIRRGLPPIGLNATRMTSLRSQVIGTLLEGEMAYVIIWNNPAQQDPVRFLTTVVTVGPYGMARVWATKEGRDLGVATASFDSPRAPVASVLACAAHCLGKCTGLFVTPTRPVAVIAFGTRTLAPWTHIPMPPVNQEKVASELEPTVGETK